ncbi:MAG: phospho-sugar mutase [Spirochaetales bacterium]|jgi:phosphoglucomutase|nr:phospho-sugar mutase [Spirochaetales bacterium]
MERSELQKRIAAYLEHEEIAVFCDEVKELAAKGSWDELEDRFYRDLEFGTGGLRGVIGGGTNRMNTFVVRRATQGLGAYVLEHAEGRQCSAVIAFDSRRYSDVFSLEAARILATMGIKTYLFTSLRPTPVLSFAVRRLQAATGIVVTASHNPPQYNGYKAYWNDGGQVTPPHDAGIIERVLAVKEVIKSLPAEELKAKGLLVMIDREIDEPYAAMVKAAMLRPELLREKGKDLKVVYTPLHGAGRVPVESILGSLGVTVTTVPEQREPDGNFLTVSYPNPEEASAMKLALELGKKNRADLVIGTDPDADRIGIAVPDARGEYALITGNQLGALLADYIFMTRTELGNLPPRPAFVKTIVTTELQRKIAESYGAASFDVLTGFKWIALLIKAFESGSDPELKGFDYVCGGEESYGYLVTTEVRDKDAVSAAVMIAEMTLYLRSRGTTILEYLHELYKRHGWYREVQISKGFAGEAGVKLMADLMNRLRQTPPKTLGGIDVKTIRDYKDGVTLDTQSGKKTKDLKQPSSNVLQFILASGTVLSARPSGTEPKIKFYVSSCTQPGLTEKEAAPLLDREIEAIKKDVEGFFK